MIFADIPSGATVFLDANTFVYHFTADPLFGSPCNVLLDRVERQDVRGLTSTHILTELAHRLMTIEAVTTFGWPVAGIAPRLRRHAADVQKLTAFRKAIETVLNSKVAVVTIAPALVVQAATISQQWGLLSNDAMAVAVMQANAIADLASNDADFDRVGGIVRYAPA